MEQAVLQHDNADMQKSVRTTV